MHIGKEAFKTKDAIAEYSLKVRSGVECGRVWYVKEGGAGLSWRTDGPR